MSGVRDWRDLDAPELTAGVPDRYLSAYGLATRVLRLVLQSERAGATAEETVGVVRRRLLALLEREGADGR